MSYKTILTVVSEGERGALALGPALDMAREHDAHLDVLCFGIDHAYPAYHYGAASLDLLQASQDEARAAAVKRQKAAEEQIVAAGVTAVARPVVAGPAGIADVLSDRGRLSDLAVMPQPAEGERSARVGEALVEGALFAAHLPVLVVPMDGAVKPWPDRIALGWDGGAEALAALRHALPLMRRAGRVDVVIVDPPRHEADRPDPGHDVCQLLSRHGVAAEVVLLPKTLPRIADVMLRHASDSQCDLVVMGAYGHSRFRETVFGGMTRAMLAEATLPLLMAR